MHIVYLYFLSFCLFFFFFGISGSRSITIHNHVSSSSWLWQFLRFITFFWWHWQFWSGILTILTILKCPSMCLSDLDCNVHAKSLQSCLTLCNPMGINPLDSSVHGILQARILEWITFRRSPPRDRIRISYASCIGSHILYHWCHLGSPLPLVSGKKPSS